MLILINKLTSAFATFIFIFRTTGLQTASRGYSSEKATENQDEKVRRSVGVSARSVNFQGKRLKRLANRLFGGAAVLLFHFARIGSAFPFKL